MLKLNDPVDGDKIDERSGQKVSEDWISEWSPSYTIMKYSSEHNA